MLATATRFTLVFLILCGLVYPLVTTAVARVIFPRQAGGSLVTRNGVVVGSTLLGQPFTDPGHFHGRVDQSLASSNLGPMDPALKARVVKAVDAWAASNPGVMLPPGDGLTRSGSGLDPHISPGTAKLQAPRIAKARGIAEAKLYTLIDQRTEGRFLGLFGEPRVNVLQLNLDLESLK